MLNNASKFAIGVAVLAGFIALSPLNDDRAAALLLLGVAVAAAVIAVGTARSLGADLPPFVAPDATPSSTPIDPADNPRGSAGPLLIGAGATLGLAGGAAGPRYLIGGIVLLVVGATLWAYDNLRTPGVLDAETAENTDKRFITPLALPLFATVTAVSIAYAFSRVLLATDKNTSVIVAGVVAAVLLAILWVIAEKTPATKVISALTALGVVVTLAAGGAGAAAGEREFHHKGDELPTVEITAKDIAFDRKVIAFPAEQEVELIFTNLDLGTFHNVAIYTAEEPGKPIYNGRPSAKGVEKYKFESPAVGTYRYICDFHPAMAGELRVAEGVETPDDHNSSESHEDTEVRDASETEESEH